MSRLEPLADVVAPAVLERAESVSAQLTALGVPHVLIGGLAVGVHGHVRATKDVDFLVGTEAFETVAPILVYRDELKDLVRIGYTDLMSVPPGFPALEEELAVEADVPVISLPALVLMKLDAARPRDRDDVRRLIAGNREQLRAVRDYLQRQAPSMVHRLAEVLAER